MSRSNIEEPSDRGDAAIAEAEEGVKGRFAGLERLMKAQGLSPMRDNKITVMTIHPVPSNRMCDYAAEAEGSRADTEIRSLLI